MNDADRKKLHDAIGATMNLQAHLTNVMSRGPRATKWWVEEAKKDYVSPAQKASLKKTAVTAAKLVKEAKVVHKDLLALQLESKKMLDRAATGKEYRDKYAAKRLASTKAFDTTTRKFLIDISTGFGTGLYPGMKEVDPQATITALNNFVTDYAGIRIQLGRI